MLNTKTILASSIFVSSLAVSAPKEIENRGRVKFQDNKISVIDLRDNVQLRSAGVQTNDVLLSICDAPVTDGSTFRKADGKLQVAETCEIKVERGDTQMSLQYVKGS